MNNQILSLLQKTANTAYKTQETLKTIASYAESSNNFHINQLDILLDKIKISSISSTYDIVVAGAGKMDVRDNVKTLYECMESVEKINSTLKGTLADSLSDNSIKQLDKNLQSLRTILDELSSCIA